MRSNININWRGPLYYLVLWIVAIVFFLPVLWIMMSAFKTQSDLLATPPKWIFTPTMDNFIDMASRANFFPYLLNSVVLSVVSVLLALLVAFLAAYSFSRFKPRGTSFLMFLLLSVRMVPAAAAVVPIYLLYSALGWKDTWPGMIIFYAMFSIPFSVWILKGFIDGVSQRFYETGLVNGASRLHILFRVVLPQIRPGLFAAFTFNAIFVWNEYLFNYILGGTHTTMIPVTLANGTFSSGGMNWGFVAALSSFYILPPVVALFVFQKHLLVGMTFGTVRGEV
jgi:multiple sugar transport system permease protein